MIATSQDTHPLTAFHDNSAEIIDLLDLAADADEVIRQGLADVAAGRTRPAREVFDEFRKKHRIPRCAFRSRRGAQSRFRSEEIRNREQ